MPILPDLRRVGIYIQGWSRLGHFEDLEFGSWFGRATFACKSCQICGKAYVLVMHFSLAFGCKTRAGSSTFSVLSSEMVMYVHPVQTQLVPDFFVEIPILDVDRPMTQVMYY